MHPTPGARSSETAPWSPLPGRPNVGKSSLLNRLLEEDRAIVTPIPGTTRDTIEEAVTLDGLRITLVDTAGIRKAGNPVEREGTRRSQRSIEQADLVLLVVDASEAPRNRDLRLIQDLQGRSALLVLNKRDMGSHTRLGGHAPGKPANPGFRPHRPGHRRPAGSGPHRRSGRPSPSGSRSVDPRTPCGIPRTCGGCPQQG